MVDDAIVDGRYIGEWFATGQTLKPALVNYKFFIELLYDGKVDYRMEEKAKFYNYEMKNLRKAIERVGKEYGLKERNVKMDYELMQATEKMNNGKTQMRAVLDDLVKEIKDCNEPRADILSSRIQIYSFWYSEYKSGKDTKEALERLTIS